MTNIAVAATLLARLEMRLRGMSLNERPGPWRPQHRSRIDLSVPSDVLYWTGLWGLTDQQLRDAVAAVGPIAADVAAYLGQPLRGEDLSRGGPREG
jgi:hypothetical protein